MSNDNVLEIRNLDKTFHMKDGDVHALENVNLTVRKGEFISILGASGCGKSTLLRIIAGLEFHDEGHGEIKVNHKKVDKPGLDRGMIFQESRLFPWLTVGDNVAFGLEEKKKKELGKQGVEELLNESLKLVGLENFKNAYPNQLSGGMQQRVSIARSLISHPQILLLDEPLGALDALTRIQMQKELLRIWEEEKTTMILVTHDIDEAIYLGDRIVIFTSRPGTVQKIINVDLARPRERNSYDFIQLRQNIYQEFFDEHFVRPEYVI